MCAHEGTLEALEGWTEAEVVLTSSEVSIPGARRRKKKIIIVCAHFSSVIQNLDILLIKKIKLKKSLFWKKLPLPSEGRLGCGRHMA